MEVNPPKITRVQVSSGTLSAAPGDTVSGTVVEFKENGKAVVALPNGETVQVQLPKETKSGDVVSFEVVSVKDGEITLKVIPGDFSKPLQSAPDSFNPQKLSEILQAILSYRNKLSNQKLLTEQQINGSKKIDQSLEVLVKLLKNYQELIRNDQNKMLKISPSLIPIKNLLAQIKLQVHQLELLIKKEHSQLPAALKKDITVAFKTLVNQMKAILPDYTPVKLANFIPIESGSVELMKNKINQPNAIQFNVVNQLAESVYRIKSGGFEALLFTNDPIELAESYLGLTKNFEILNQGLPNLNTDKQIDNKSENRSVTLSNLQQVFKTIKPLLIAKRGEISSTSFFVNLLTGKQLNSISKNPHLVQPNAVFQLNSFEKIASSFGSIQYMPATQQLEAHSQNQGLNSLLSNNQLPATSLLRTIAGNVLLENGLHINQVKVDQLPPFIIDQIKSIYENFKKDIPQFRNFNIPDSQWIDLLTKWHGKPLPGGTPRLPFLISQHIQQQFLNNFKNVFFEFNQLPGSIQNELSVEIPVLYKLLNQLKELDVNSFNTKDWVNLLKDQTKSGGIFLEGKLAQLNRDPAKNVLLTMDIKKELLIFKQKFSTFYPGHTGMELLKEEFNQLLNHIETSQRFLQDSQNTDLLHFIGNDSADFSNGMIQIKRGKKGNKKIDEENSSIKMSLFTSILKDVFIDMSIKKGRISIIFKVSNSRFVNLFSANIGEFGQEMENLNYKIEKISIEKVHQKPKLANKERQLLINTKVKGLDIKV